MTTISEPDKSAPHVICVADLPQGKPHQFTVVPSARDIESLREDLDLIALRKVKFSVMLSPSGKTNWQLKGQLGATVVQPCVATLAPVTTRIDTDVLRRFVTDFEPPQDEEAEMPEDDTVEPLEKFIDLLSVLRESLALAIPAYPRAEDAGPVSLAITEPGKTAMSDEDARPFAGLAALRDQLTRDDD